VAAMSALQHVEDLVSSPKRAQPREAPAEVQSGLTWGSKEAGGSQAGLPEVKVMAEPAERPRRQTKAPGISTWEAVSQRANACGLATALGPGCCCPAVQQQVSRQG